MAQESRLAEEEAYRKILADEKERRAKEQKLYGDYLKVMKGAAVAVGIMQFPGSRDNPGLSHAMMHLFFDEQEKLNENSLCFNMQDQMMQAAARKASAEEKLRSFLETSRMEQNAKDIQLRRRLGQINVQESHIALG